MSCTYDLTLGVVCVFDFCDCIVCFYVLLLNVGVLLYFCLSAYAWCYLSCFLVGVIVLP